MTQTEPDNLPTTEQPQDMQDKLVSLLFTESTIKDAGLKAGYAPTTCSSTIYTLLKQPAFQNKLRQYAIQNDLLSLPQLAKIESKCLDVVANNPEKYPKFKEIFRQKKQVAGLLAPDAVPAQPTINIRTIEHLQVVVGDAVQKRLANE